MPGAGGDWIPGVTPGVTPGVSQFKVDSLTSNSFMIRITHHHHFSLQSSGEGCKIKNFWLLALEFVWCDFSLSHTQKKILSGNLGPDGTFKTHEPQQIQLFKDTQRNVPLEPPCR